MSASELLRQGLSSLQGGNLRDAERHFQKLLQREPESIAGLNLYSVVLTQLGRLEEAEQHVRKAIYLGPPSEPSLYNHGTILKALKRPPEAVEQFTRALAINSQSADALNNRGAAYADLGRPADAVSDFDRAIALKPDFAEAHINRGNALTKLGTAGDALAAYERAIALKPMVAEAWLGKANVLTEAQRFDDALPCFHRAIELNPRGAEAWASLGMACIQTYAYASAVDAFDRALTSQPDAPRARDGRTLAKLHLCDWSNFDCDVAAVLEAIRHGVQTVPSSIVALPATPADLLQAARSMAAGLARPTGPVSAPSYDHARIRVAYVSGDFHAHATAELMAGVFEHHDRSRFEALGISYGPNDQSPMRRRLETAFDGFHDVRERGDDQVAALLRELEVDVAVDLKGWTQGARLGVFARRPAPVQVTYLGYPGTTGADFFDYLIADQIVVPETHRQFYSENVVWMPDTYQANDDHRAIAETAPTRAECGLPDGAFVFCCFNNFYKITPAVFDVWMHLLRQVEGSILWLVAAHERGGDNLRREAQVRGVSPERLVIAPRRPAPEHLARHCHADLMLDTLIYNAHTTAADALWAGVPVVTVLGDAFPGRVAASLLHAVGLPELVTTSLGDYEALALKLARDPAALAAIRSKLETTRNTTALFDTARFTRNIEAAYLEMVRRLRAGLPPGAFSVASTG